MGHDYKYFLPRILDNYIWIEENTFFSIRWFTPSFCGGVPSYANPQDMYFSVPQLLTLWFDPVNSIYLTILIFASIGFFGMYSLLRGVFRTVRSASFLGGILFMLNGCYFFRMVIGHLTFHAFMLLPGVASLLFLREGERHGDFRSLWRLGLAILGMSYMSYAGMITHLAIPAGLILIAIGSVSKLVLGYAQGFWSRLTFACFGAIGISMSKLTACFSFLGQFQRTLYPIPGFRGLSEAVLAAIQTVFFAPDVPGLMSELINYGWSWPLGQHEWEYGVGPFPLVVLLVFSGCLLFEPLERGRAWQKLRKSGLYVLWLLTILLIPLILNIHIAGLEQSIKSIPILRSHAKFIHWFCIYIPVSIVAAAVVVDRLSCIKDLRKTFVILGVILTMLGLAVHPTSFYHGQSYKPQFIKKTWERARDGRSLRIDRVDASYGEEALTQKASSMPCYEPIFGYRLEKYPKRSRRLGDVTSLVDGFYNLNNPACFVFPKENGCEPGDCFTEDQADSFEKFRRFRAFPFEMSFIQRASNIVSLVSIGLLAVVISLGPVLRRHARTDLSSLTRISIL